MVQSIKKKNREQKTNDKNNSIIYTYTYTSVQRYSFVIINIID